MRHLKSKDATFDKFLEWPENKNKKILSLY